MFYVYIATNEWDNVLYTGYTNNLRRRISEHKNGSTPGFTKKYNIKKLIYFESYSSSREARLREKQIKAGSRSKKFKLVWSMNPKREDLSDRDLF